MFNIDTTRLNPFDRKIVDELVAQAEKDSSLRVREAAAIYGCSISQVSKAIKKAGFGGYKNFIQVLYTRERPREPALEELESLKRVIDDFDLAVVDDFVSLICELECILLFGYGPAVLPEDFLARRGRRRVSGRQNASDSGNHNLWSCPSRT